MKKHPFVLLSGILGFFVSAVLQFSTPIAEYQLVPIQKVQKPLLPKTSDDQGI